jgi:hypothetical protein
VIDTSIFGIEDLDGARHLEPDHGLLDALDQGGS